MACNGHSNSCPSHPSYIGPGTATSWTSPDPMTAGTKITTTYWNELRNAVDNETSRRNETWNVGEPGSRAVGDPIYEHYDNLRDQLYYLGATTRSALNDPNLNDGYVVEAEETDGLRDATNELEVQCVCNCAYSCTCNCNYCTCNCNYCTCNCNYPCTCNCNYYSDERLKTEIEEL